MILQQVKPPAPVQLVYQKGWVKDVRTYRQRFLNHVLLVSEQPDGTYNFEILGPKRVGQEKGYHSALEAKQAAHSLAHRHLENKRDCDCVERLVWSEEKS